MYIYIYVYIYIYIYIIYEYIICIWKNNKEFVGFKVLNLNWHPIESIIGTIRQKNNAKLAILDSALKLDISQYLAKQQKTTCKGYLKVHVL